MVKQYSFKKLNTRKTHMQKDVEFHINKNILVLANLFLKFLLIPVPELESTSAGVRC